jgi:hypothetical protein
MSYCAERALWSIWGWICDKQGESGGAEVSRVGVGTVGRRFVYDYSGGKQMSHVSFNTARRLKAAGLEPRFERWQKVYLPNGNPAMVLFDDGYFLYVYTEKGRKSPKKDHAVWAPGTDELLDWLDGQGCMWRIDKDWFHLLIDWLDGKWMAFPVGNRPDAVGDAVLWVLEQKELVAMPG